MIEYKLTTPANQAGVSFTAATAAELVTHVTGVAAEDKAVRFEHPTLGVKVAVDVLRSLPTLRLKPKWGFVRVTEGDGYSQRVAAVRKAMTESSAADPQLAAAAHCTVCALGACVLSLAKLNGRPLHTIVKLDTADLPALDNRETVDAMLAGAFDPDTLGLIESAFEGENHIRGRDDHAGQGREAMARVYQFREQVRNKWGALDPRPNFSALIVKAVMENVVEHGGKFVV